jgi:hypothetical protein
LQAKPSARIRPLLQEAAAVTEAVLTKPVNERLTILFKRDVGEGVRRKGIDPAAFFGRTR